MGATSATPGSTGEGEAEAVPEGAAARATASDPLMSAMGKLSDNPMSNIIPIDWMEISEALQTLHERQTSDTERTKRVATDYNRRLFETTVKVWSDAASRFSGLPRQEEEEKGKPDKRFSDPEWESNPHYKMLKETYLLASEYILEEAEETDDGQDAEEQQRLKFHLKQFVDAMAPVNFFPTNPAAIRRAMETGGTSLADGARNLASDLEEGRLSMVDA
ncbi:MAG: class I poly(R)-hydroxyalkanoic acid synthase, partial [Rubrobacter sp.]